MKKWTLIGDSCCDLREADLTTKDIAFKTCPLVMTVADRQFVDDEALDVNEFIAAYKAEKTVTRTACPSPEVFEKAMEDAGGENIFVVTITGNLSGTYAAALIAAENYKKKHEGAKVHVCDSRSASVGEAKLLYFIKDEIEKGSTFEEIAEKVDNCRNKMQTRFILQDLSNLAKNGRVGKIMHLIAKTVLLKLICGATPEGEIEKVGMTLSTQKGLQTMSNYPAEKIAEEGVDMPLYISHCNNEKDANFLKSLIESKFGLKKVKILITRGLASFYAAEKGIIMAY
ncbi:MAG: DegV family protein [Christensenellaceae bacterium]|jgi:DegV family protein with EDD domain|nr:DegV family protein [Christensenellaceae bacterium]